MVQVKNLFFICIVIALLAAGIAPVTAGGESLTDTPVVNGTVLSGLVSPENTSDPLLNTSANDPHYQEAGSNGNWVISDPGEAWQVDGANSTAPNYDSNTNTFSGFGTGFALLINASNVIFDGMGAILDGGGNTDYGIIVNNQSADNYNVFDNDPANALSGISITNITLINFNIAGILFNNVVGAPTIDNSSVDLPASEITAVNASDNNLVGNTAGGGIVLQDSRYIEVSDNTAKRNRGNNSFTSDIYLNSSDNNILVNNTATRNHMGFYLNSSGNNTLIGNTANSNWAGIVLENSSNNTLVNNNADLNNDTGILVVISSNNNSLINNTANSNEWEGITVEASSNHNTLIGNTANSNYWDGISIHDSGNNTLIGNTANSNIYGVYLSRNSCNNTLISNTANSNTDTGIYLRISDKNNILIGNNVSGNTIYGIYINFSSNNNILISNNANGNYYGFYLRNSSDNTLISNNATGNDYGIYLMASGNNTLIGNTANNSYIGIRLFVSNANNLTNNTANSNWAGIDSASSNNNIFISNTANGNEGEGIRLFRNSNNNTLTNNTANSNSYGIYVGESSNNTLNGNLITENNESGLYLAGSSSSQVIYNNYFNNTVDAAFDDDYTGMGNTWNVNSTPGTNIIGGPYTGGNYWATPDGTGFSETHPDRGDGFCDESYVINEGETDYLPLHTYTQKPTFYADFTVSPVSGTAPLTVYCADKSLGNPTRFMYDFGDGVNVSGPNPVHTYRYPGTFSITLTIMKYNSATNSVIGNSTTKRDVITVSKVPFVMPVAKFTASPVNGTAPLTVTFTDQSTGSPTYMNYDFGDGINMSGPNPIHTYRYPGVYNVTLTVLKNDASNGSIVSNSSVQNGLIRVN